MDDTLIVSHVPLGIVTWNEDRPPPLGERGAGNTPRVGWGKVAADGGKSYFWGAKLGSTQRRLERRE